MKTLFKSLLVAVASMSLFTACIEEYEPTNAVIQEQLEGSTMATEALLWGIVGHNNVIGTLSSSYHYDAGYPAEMHIRDVMTNDMPVDYAGGYDWYSSWSSVSYIDSRYVLQQFVWNFYYEHVLTCNNLVSAFANDPEPENATMKAYLGAGLASRAHVYMDMARQYEVLPTTVNTGYSDDGSTYIVGLTVPIVTETTTEEEAKDNPRATHDEMVAFIKSDLDRAINLLSEGAAISEKTLPSLAVAYGLMARLMLWDASYQEEVGDASLAPALYASAKEYANLAIANHSGSPLTKSEWLDTSKGFNSSDFGSWMYCLQYTSEDDAVVAGGIRTWTSFLAPEQVFGYAAPAQGAFPLIDASLYNKISDRDFRKYTFVAPEGSAIADQVVYIDKDWAAENLYELVSVKFRPAEGNMDDYTVGSVAAVPFMRVEEMYFIAAEAEAHINPAAGNALLKDFMTTYRYPSYVNAASSEEEVVNEIILQKRIEFYGEGLTFFDIKRLNMSVTRFYDGTNWDTSRNTYNTEGRPAWLNMVITLQEAYNNAAIEKTNTPSPCDIYDVLY